MSATDTEANQGTSDSDSEQEGVEQNNAAARVLEALNKESEAEKNKPVTVTKMLPLTMQRGLPKVIPRRSVLRHNPRFEKDSLDGSADGSDPIVIPDDDKEGKPKTPLVSPRSNPSLTPVPNQATTTQNAPENISDCFNLDEVDNSENAQKVKDAPFQEMNLPDEQVNEVVNLFNEGMIDMISDSSIFAQNEPVSVAREPPTPEFGQTAKSFRKSTDLVAHQSPNAPPTVEKKAITGEANTVKGPTVVTPVKTVPVTPPVQNVVTQVTQTPAPTHTREQAPTRAVKHGGRNRKVYNAARTTAKIS